MGRGMECKGLLESDQEIQTMRDKGENLKLYNFRATKASYVVYLAMMGRGNGVQGTIELTKRFKLRRDKGENFKLYNFRATKILCCLLSDDGGRGNGEFQALQLSCYKDLMLVYLAMMGGEMECKGPLESDQEIQTKER
ncbi:hypothetical protein AVEN_61170-1 [Araneus ventricosus]|uniref:Uncharacterized protein n=1 Tax=Araneus ventricosus TaxID=182803 RepID=A0A4Y2SQI0_ARAVE|nr:hypothetical protein AVEN_61170-1 [Araneus ventricosus]